MRIVIKNADFSSVSIGKVIEDLSFSFSITNENVNENVLNPPSVALTSSALVASPENNDGTTIYLAESSGSTFDVRVNNKNRWVTDFFEVTEGMIINLTSWYSGGEANTPNVVCFDENKNVMNPPNGCWSGSSYIIPSGCHYIKFQSSQIRLNQGASGTMPQ